MSNMEHTWQENQQLGASDDDSLAASSDGHGARDVARSVQRVNVMG